jgi:hypothetical protein
MALLRVADYLQIDRKRAPAVLLQLRDPQSPVSVQEWGKHLAVEDIGPADDPRAKFVKVSERLSLSLYLQLGSLLAGIQEEMDHSTAVLDEVYGARIDLGLNRLGLATRRIRSNLQDPVYRDSLPYVPSRTGFTADPHLLTLLVEPLYGKYPTVGVRELIQNAADAVRELEAWCKSRNRSPESLGLPEQDGDVVVTYSKRDDGSWFLHVRDRGIGMTADTIANYFLRAGASFRRSSEWAREFLDDRGKPRVVRAGRFGIGAFAVFLLGPSFRLWTRHVGADASRGYTIAASANSRLIEIKRVDGLPVGTTIEAEMSTELVRALGLEPEEGSDDVDREKMFDWFCWDWPKVVTRVTDGTDSHVLARDYALPIGKGELPPEWSAISPDGFDAVYWTFGSAPKISCNGLILAHPSEPRFREAEFYWPDAALGSPRIAVLDSTANLPVTIQRYELSQAAVPFIDELRRDVMLSFIAHALVCGPASQVEALSQLPTHPLLGDPISRQEAYDVAGFSWSPLRWCATSTKFVPADPWLYALLDTKSCLVYGTIDFGDRYPAKSPAIGHSLDQTTTAGYAVFPTHHAMRFYMLGEPERARGIEDWLSMVFGRLADRGVEGLGHEVTASHVLISTNREFHFRSFGSGGREPETIRWRETPVPDSLRQRHEAAKGAIVSPLPLKNAIVAMEAEYQVMAPDYPVALFAAEFRTRRATPAPESLIAKLWNECLGANAIPFDGDARGRLIADGSKHPELRRHIEAWTKMKPSGSRWANNARTAP